MQIPRRLASLVANAINAPFFASSLRSLPVGRNSDSQLILRESAMCAPSDESSFQDILKHRYFNTNNLWIRLDKLKETVDAFGGFIPLPMIKNKKTVDPKDEGSQKVIQVRGLGDEDANVRR